MRACVYVSVWSDALTSTISLPGIQEITHAKHWIDDKRKQELGRGVRREGAETAMWYRKQSIRPRRASFLLHPPPPPPLLYLE